MICLVVMMYVRYPLSLRNVEDFLFERGIEAGWHFQRRFDLTELDQKAPIALNAKRDGGWCQGLERTRK